MRLNNCSKVAAAILGLSTLAVGSWKLAGSGDVSPPEVTATKPIPTLKGQAENRSDIAKLVVPGTSNLSSNITTGLYNSLGININPQSQILNEFLKLSQSGDFPKSAMDTLKTKLQFIKEPASQEILIKLAMEEVKSVNQWLGDLGYTKQQINSIYQDPEFIGRISKLLSDKTQDSANITLALNVLEPLTDGLAPQQADALLKPAEDQIRKNFIDTQARLGKLDIDFEVPEREVSVRDWLAMAEETRLKLSQVETIMTVCERLNVNQEVLGRFLDKFLTNPGGSDLASKIEEIYERASIDESGKRTAPPSSGVFVPGKHTLNTKYAYGVELIMKSFTAGR